MSVVLHPNSLPAKEATSSACELGCILCFLSLAIVSDTKPRQTVLMTFNEHIANLVLLELISTSWPNGQLIS